MNLTSGNSDNSENINKFLSGDRLLAARNYTRGAWIKLFRDLTCIVKAAEDPKMSREKFLIYVSPKEDLSLVTQKIFSHIPVEDRNKIEIQTLPEIIANKDSCALLYIPHPYVVPGWRFNEVYGWDSYFACIGLLHDNKVELAKELTNAQLYQVEHFGSVLNANRAYYLGRTQPPFLSKMVLDVFWETLDYDWLFKSYNTLVKYHSFWHSGNYLHTESGLSRYYATGSGPSPEVLSSEVDPDTGHDHFHRVASHFQEMIDSGSVPKDFNISLFYNKDTKELTELFYTADRSMRESGFDPSSRFGPLSAEIIFILPVCLNALLFSMEEDLASICEILGKKHDTKKWLEKAQARKASLLKHCWDEDKGIFFDYHIDNKTRVEYEYLSIYFPMWAGIVDKATARKLVDKLPLFERDWGLMCSTTASGCQWDAPFGWPNLHYIVVSALLRYGFVEDAVRIMKKFTALVMSEFEVCGTFFEKYNVCTGSSKTADSIAFGYDDNVSDFVMTIAVFIDFQNKLSKM
jgi:alpha,alpha-trehalase